MDQFVFSMDSHVVEPRTLWQENLPARFKNRALRSERQDKYIVMIADNKPLHRMQIGDGNSADPRIGGTDPELRAQDMAKDGIDAELLFPNLGNMIYAIEDGELAAACCQVYNDWVIKQFGAYRDTFVPAAVAADARRRRDARRVPPRARTWLPHGDAANGAAGRPSLQRPGARPDLGARAGTPASP